MILQLIADRQRADAASGCRMHGLVALSVDVDASEMNSAYNNSRWCAFSRMRS
jgi:hypothetical protein